MQANDVPRVSAPFHTLPDTGTAPGESLSKSELEAPRRSHAAAPNGRSAPPPACGNRSMKLPCSALPNLFWNLYAQAYDALPRHFAPYNKQLAEIRERRRRLRAGDQGEGKAPGPLRVLDAGCGTGNYAVAFARDGDDAVGLDSAPFMLRRAAHKADREGLAVYWCQASLDDPLPFGDGAFDQVVSVNALYMLRDPKRALREFHRVLKPGGLAWISHPSRMPSLAEIVAEQRRELGLLKTVRLAACLLAVGLFNIIIKRRFKGGEYFLWDADGLTAELEAAGFQIIDVATAYVAGANTLVEARKP